MPKDKMRTIVSRRDFLKSSATAGLGAALAGGALGQTAQNPGGRSRPRPGRTTSAWPSSAPASRAASSSNPACASPASASPRSATSGLTAGNTPGAISASTARTRTSTKTIGTCWPKRKTSPPRSSPRRTGCTPSTPTPPGGRAPRLLRKGNVELARESPVHRRDRPADGTALQIGHQRRSNPRYIHAIDRLIREKKILGRVNLAYAQWNRSKADMLGWPKTYPIAPDKLQSLWLRLHGGVPQLALVQKVRRRSDRRPRLAPDRPLLLGLRRRTRARSSPAAASTTTKTANGSTTSWPSTNSRRPRERPGRFYQVQTTTKYGGFYEVFMGDDGALQISEVTQRGNWAMREAHAPEWDSLVKDGLLLSEAPAIQKVDTRNIFVDVRVTAEAGRWPLPVDLAKPAHQPHLENFFSAVRGGTPLSCPAALAYESAVAVLKVNEAVSTRSFIRFSSGIVQSMTSIAKMATAKRSSPWRYRIRPDFKLNSYFADFRERLRSPKAKGRAKGSPLARG